MGWARLNATFASRYSRQQSILLSAMVCMVHHSNSQATFRYSSWHLDGIQFGLVDDQFVATLQAIQLAGERLASLANVSFSDVHFRMEHLET